MVQRVCDEQAPTAAKHSHVVGVVEVRLGGLALAKAADARAAHGGDRAVGQLADAVARRVHVEDVAAAVARVEAREAGATGRLVVAGWVELVGDRAAEPGVIAPRVIPVAIAAKLGPVEGAVLGDGDAPRLGDGRVERGSVQGELLAVARLRGVGRGSESKRSII